MSRPDLAEMTALLSSPEYVRGLTCITFAAPPSTASTGASDAAARHASSEGGSSSRERSRSRERDRIRAAVAQTASPPAAAAGAASGASASASAVVPSGKYEEEKEAVPDCVTASTKLPDGITWTMGRWLRCDCDSLPWQAHRTTLKELQKHRKEGHGPASEEAAAAATISVPVDALSVGTCTSEQCSSSHEAAFITALLEQRGGSPNRQHRILVRQMSPEQWHSLGSLESKLIALDFAPRDEILSDAQRVKLMQQHIRPRQRVEAPPEFKEFFRREGLDVEREEDGYFDALWTEWEKESAVEHPVVCLILYDWKEIAQADEPDAVRASASWASVGKWFGRTAPVVYKLFAFDIKVDRGSQTPDGTRSGASGSVSVYPLAFPGAGVHVAVTPTVDEDIQQPDQVSTTSSALGLKRTETRITQTIHRHTPNSIQFSGTHPASRKVTLLQWHPKVQQMDSTTSTSTAKTSWAGVPVTESAPVTTHSGPQAGARVSAPSVPTDAEFRVAGVASVPTAARAIPPVNLHKPW